MTVAIFPGGFDPITLGQVDIARRAAALFDRLVVGVFAAPEKRLLFDLESRLRLTRESLAELDNLSVVAYEGLTVDLAREQGATVIVRGLRAVSDFEHEFQMALMSRELAPEIDVVSLMTAAEYTYLSSSIVKEVALLGGNVEPFVPTVVLEALQARLG